MNEIDLTRILDEIAELSQPPRLATSEFTHAMFAEHTGLSKDVAARRLERLHFAQQVTRRQVLHAGRRCWAYRRASGTMAGV